MNDQSGWLRAIDEELVMCHLGTAEPDDSFGEARRKLQALIQWHVDVATDPATNGGFQLVPVRSMHKVFEAAKEKS